MKLKSAEEISPFKASSENALKDLGRIYGEFSNYYHIVTKIVVIKIQRKLQI